MPIRPHNQGKAWTPQDVSKLRSLVRQNTPTRVIGLKMRRSPASIYSKASDEGISLKPTNLSPYNRRKKS